MKRSWGLVLTGVLLLLVVLGCNYANRRFQAHVSYAEGVTAYQAQDMQAAVASFSEAIRVAPPFCPEKAPAYFWRGAARYSLGEYAEATDDFNEAIRLDPSNAAAYRNRGAAYHRQGEEDLALADLDESLRLDPSDVEAYLARCRVYRKKGEDGRARA